MSPCFPVNPNSSHCYTSSDALAIQPPRHLSQAISVSDFSNHLFLPQHPTLRREEPRSQAIQPTGLQAVSTTQQISHSHRHPQIPQAPVLGECLSSSRRSPQCARPLILRPPPPLTQSRPDVSPGHLPAVSQAGVLNQAGIHSNPQEQ